MLDIALHAGTEHPNLVWILVPSFLSFVAGLGIGASSDRLHAWMNDTDTSTAD